jgi:chromosomal replication initiator protein
MKNELTDIGFKTWIKTIKPIRINNERIILSVPNEFNKNIIEGRYIELIKNSIIEIASIEYEIEIITDDTINISQNENINIETKEITYDNKFLNKEHTFENFVVGNSNRFAHAACLAVAESPAKAYNPLFLYGGSGLGKTHLLHAIGNYILEQTPTTKVVYITSEEFTNELINAIKDDRNEEFRNKYRTMDILLVDDIQFIGGKERTQEEFFHTFNALYTSNKQIILTSDRPPREIHTLEERLRTRFEQGLIGDVQAPDLETRIAILKKKAQRENLNNISDEIYTYIANKIISNIRELEGALNRIKAYKNISTKNITIELVDEILKDILYPKENVITPKLIKDITAKYFNVKGEDLQSKKRTKNIAYPRQIAMYLTRELLSISLTDIGEFFGGRDHTTVIHAISKVEEDIKNSSEIKNTITTLIKDIKEK